MTNKKKMLKDTKKTDIIINVAKTEETIKANCVGKIEYDKFVLNEVLYIPNLTTNLLSVNSITKNGGEVNFTKDKVTIKSNNKTVLQGGNYLYKERNYLMIFFK